MTTSSGHERPLPRSLMPYYARTLKFTVPNGLHLYRDQILNALAASGVRQELITAIGQAGSRNTWFIKFSSDDVVKQQCGHPLTFKAGDGKKIGTAFLTTPFDDDVFITYRLLWLPLGFETAKAVSLISKLDPKVQIVDAWEEKMKSNNKINTGNILVKVKQTRTHLSTIRTGMHLLFADWTFVISRVGEPRKCLLCGSLTHIKKDCKRQALECSKCTGKYHEAEECDYSWKLKAGLIKEQALLDDILNDEEEMLNVWLESAGAVGSRTAGGTGDDLVERKNNETTKQTEMSAEETQPHGGTETNGNEPGDETNGNEPVAETNGNEPVAETNGNEPVVTTNENQMISYIDLSYQTDERTTEGPFHSTAKEGPKRPAQGSIIEDAPKPPKSMKDDENGHGGSEANTSVEDGEIDEDDGKVNGEETVSIDDPFSQAGKAKAVPAGMKNAQAVAGKANKQAVAGKTTPAPAAVNPARNNNKNKNNHHHV